MEKSESLDQSASTDADREEAAAVVENFIDTYQIQAEWIRFADAKAGAVLTAIAALMGLLIPTFQPWLAELQESGTLMQPLALVTVSIFVVWLICAAISGVFAFRCIAPFRQKGSHPAETTCQHFHSVGISKAYGIKESERFVTDAEKLGTSGFKKQVLAGILFDAHISSAKYGRVLRAIRFLGLSAIFAVVYLLILQF